MPSFGLYLLLASVNVLAQQAYQVGSVFSRVSPEQSSIEPELSRSIVSIGRSTGFYIGDINDRSFFITNRHVIRSQQLCRASVVRTPAGVFPCRRVIASWEDIDLVILETGLVRGLAPLKLETRREIQAGELLSVGGYGRLGSVSALPSLTFNEDDDCRAFLGQSAAMQLNDPDEVNPTPGFVWSLPIGCDVMHGDSGAPVLRRGSQRIVGIVWTGVFPKSPVAQDSTELKRILQQQRADSQSLLNYMVPAASIAEVLRNSLSEDENDVKAQIIRQLLGES